VLHARLPREIGAVVRKALEVAVEAVRESKQVSAETPLQVPAVDNLRARAFLRHNETPSGAASVRPLLMSHESRTPIARRGVKSRPASI
jgi:hypothetical protein